MKTKSKPGIGPAKRPILQAASESDSRREAAATAKIKLAGEVARRRVAETSLKQSRRHQVLLLRRSEHMQTQMRNLSRRLIDAQEEERRHISRELHDQVLQTLVGINVHLENLSKSAQLDLARLKPKIMMAQNLVADSVSAIHRFARELRPLILDDLGLVPAIHSYLTDFRERTALHVRFSTYPEVEDLTSARRTAIYRVIQSALSNIAEHAAAQNVRISIRKIGEICVLTVHDDGRSFNVSRTLDSRSYRRLGLLGMRERIEMIGGNFSIDSSPPRGTTIRAEIPIEPLTPTKKNGVAIIEEVPS